MSLIGAAEALEHAAPLFGALGDATRLHLVERLAREGPLSITVLAGDATISRQAITKHLQALEEVGLAESRREGRERIFKLRPEKLATAQRYLDQMSGQWDAAIERLRAHVERDGLPRQRPGAALHKPRPHAVD